MVYEYERFPEPLNGFFVEYNGTTCHVVHGTNPGQDVPEAVYKLVQQTLKAAKAFRVWRAGQEYTVVVPEVPERAWTKKLFQWFCDALFKFSERRKWDRECAKIEAIKAEGLRYRDV